MMNYFVNLRKIRYGCAIKPCRLYAAAIMLALLLVGCAKEPPLHFLFRKNAFLPSEQVATIVNQHYPNAHIFEVRFRQGRGDAYERNYRYEITLAANHGNGWRALKIDAHDGRILSDEPFYCGLLKGCPWKRRWFERH